MDSTDWVTLIKPQFEVGRQKVGKGGIVTDPEDRQKAIEDIYHQLNNTCHSFVTLVFWFLTNPNSKDVRLTHNVVSR